MKYSRNFAIFVLLCCFAASNLGGEEPQERSKVGLCTIKGKIFRSDSNEAISNSYILIMQEKDSPLQVEHFDIRTDDKGDYRFRDIPAGRYTVSIYAWFSKRSGVPCQSSSTAKTTDQGKVTVEWQRKSEAFMEIVTIKGFSVEAGHETLKDFDLLCK